MIAHIRPTDPMEPGLRLDVKGAVAADACLDGEIVNTHHPKAVSEEAAPDCVKAAAQFAKPS